MLEEIWRYPVKSAQGERVASIRLGPEGPDGDRAWACVTADDGDEVVVSAKHPRRWGRMLDIVARTGDDGTVTIRTPGHPEFAAGSAAADDAASAWLGARVRMANVVPPLPRLHRLWPDEPGMIPEWAADATAGGEVLSEITAVVSGRFVDFGAVHLITTKELGELRADVPAADARRFRPNLVLSLDAAPRPGDVIRVGDATLRVLVPTPRCAIPAARQPGLEKAPELLKAVARNRVDIPGRGRAACFGSYAEVLSPGIVAVGDQARLVQQAPH